MALQYGIFAANFPLADEELEAGRLPNSLLGFRNKLYGLAISAERLQQIRNERRPNSKYASPAQVQYELRAAEAIFRRYDIPFIDTTEYSIEEIASRILDRTGWSAACGRDTQRRPVDDSVEESGRLRMILI